MVAGLESSLWYSIAATIISLLLGGGLAVAERLWQQPMRRWFMSVMLLPVFLPPVIVSTSFIVLPLPLYTPWAVILAFCYYNVPLAYLLLRTAISRISSTTETAAEIMGANRWQRWQTVLLPQLKLPLLGVAAIIFLYCFTSFILPLQLGGVHGQTLEVWLYQQIYLYHQPGTALLAAGMQFGILALLIVLSYRSVTYSVSTKTVPEQFLGHGWPIRIIRFLLSSIVLVPLIHFGWKLLSTVSMTDVVTLWDSNFLPALVRTIVIMIIAVSSAIVIVWFGRFGTRFALIWLTVSPVTISFLWYQLLGKGYISLLGSFVLLVLPICTLLIHQARSQISTYVFNTARLLGADWWQRAHLELGLLRPTLRQAIIWSSVIVVGDATISSAVAPYGSPLAMPYALQLIGSYRFAVGSLAMLIIMSVIGTIIFFGYARRS